MTANTSGYDFLAGGGEMGALMRAKDWSQTALGTADTWPQSLRTAVSILLNSRYPMFVFWGPQLVKIYNDGYRPITGDKHPWALGRPGREVWPEIWDAIGPMVERVVRHGEATWSDDLQLFMRRRGFPEEVFFTFSYSPIRDESGGIGGMFCACTETTLKVQGERRLKLLRDLAAAAAEARTVADACALSAGVLAGNPADIPFGLIYLFEEGGARLAGTAGVLPDDDPHDWPLDGARQVGNLGGLFRAVPAGPWPEPPASAMVLPLMDRGQDRPSGALVLGISSRVLFDESYRGFFDLVAGQLAASIANARASEEERRRLEALSELDRAKTAFFSNVSHEFRTPLTLMLGPVEDGLADAEQPLPPAQRARLELARRSGLRLLKLVNSLLDFSRIEAGRAQASYVATDLAALTADLASSFRSAVEKAGLKLTIACPPCPQPAYVDRDMWEKIVLNLLSNAFKFTFEGEIAVRLRQTAQRIELAVRDTGTGIPAAELPHVFERFRRVEGARSRTHEGTGIGLALVQELVRQHGGTVSVHSVEGAGSTFTVSMPAGKAHLPAERVGAERALASTALGATPFVEEAARWLPDAEPPPAAAEGRPRIVWADDNADMREYVRRLLGARYEVHALPDGQAALAAARELRPDLVLSDVMLPGLDGLGLARALRAHPATRAIPVILLSARAGEEARIEGLDAGADDYLYKPFSARELLAQVAARLELGRLQARLQQERADLEALFAQTPVPTAVLRGPELVFEMANPAYLQVVGGREILGKPLLEALPEARGQGFDGLLREVLRSGVAHVGRETLVRLARNGTIEDAYFTFIYAPLRGEGGAVERVIAIVNDVTEQVRARDRIRESEERYRSLVALLPAAVYTCAASGVITFYNAHAVALWGRAPALGDTDERFCGSLRLWRPDGTALPHRETPMAVALLEGREFRNQEVVIERPDGSRITVLVSIDPIRDERGGVVGAINVFHDTTALKQAERTLKEADRRKDEFLAMLSHELRNPLAPIRNAVTLLQEAHAEAPLREQACAILDRQVDHMIRLVDDLLDIARISRGSISLQKRPVSLAAVVESAVETGRPLLEANGHRLALDLPREPIVLSADPVRLAQVIANLINNAAKYTAPGGRIGLCARPDPGWVSVSVTDNGIGIEPGALPQVFEMFSQIDSTRRRAPGGLGVGLALARQLVELHGGSIEAHSEGLGRGSRFTVRLPLPASLAPAGLQASTPARQAGAGRRVLVVDDNVDAADSLGMMLEQMGHSVQVSYDGRAALAAARRNVPDIVLLDLDLPQLDGFAVARLLRQDRRLDRVPIVAVTGFGQEADRSRARQAGFDEHLVKPVDPDVLRCTLELIPWKHTPAAR
ncbi:MAG TPA: ATP-binding protein [Burkholderiales bacterium]